MPSAGFHLLPKSTGGERDQEVSIRIHLVNPSDVSFGIGVITPRWLYVIAAATPSCYGELLITDETLERFNPELVCPGDVVGIGIHTANAFRGLEVGRTVRHRGAWVIFGESMRLCTQTRLLNWAQPTP